MAVTESEAYLESLARKSFLSMWSYSNLAFGDSATGKGGKELCDLLVVFRNNIILFSDKSCKYPVGPDADLNWNRWYKRSIKKSVDQLIGAKKTLRQSTQHIFTDAKLHTPFPLALPQGDLARIFLIAVSHESKTACTREYGRSSLKIDSRLGGSEERLAVGVRFGDDFVHLLDDSTVEIILQKLDTIVDFIKYLDHKEIALSRSDFIIHGEENLLASYLANRDLTGRHFIPSTRSDQESGPLVVKSGAWAEYVASNSYRLSVEANMISYNIDMLIEHFTNSYSGGHMVQGQNEPLAYHEEGLRLLASESRLGRRVISTSFVSLYNEEVTTTFWASTVPSCETKGLRYVFLTYPELPNGIDLETCERFILEHLSQHLLVARHQFPDSRILVGIALPNRDCTIHSHFIRILDGENWTPEDDANADDLQRRTGIFNNLQEERYIHIE